MQGTTAGYSVRRRGHEIDEQPRRQTLTQSMSKSFALCSARVVCRFADGSAVGHRAGNTVRTVQDLILCIQIGGTEYARIAPGEFVSVSGPFYNEPQNTTAPCASILPPQRLPLCGARHQHGQTA
jgi:hypothetical protein